MAKVEIPLMPNAGVDVEQLDLLYVAGRNVRLQSYSGRQFGRFLHS